MTLKLAAVAALIAFALPCGARADVSAQRAVSVDPTLSHPIGHPLAGDRVARRSRPLKKVSPDAPRGAPPGPEYCWYYIDRSTRTPGFWDLCRGR
jgi:hypothetical protein